MTPKERFLKLFYTALANFEDETGVEIHGIKIERTPIETSSGREAMERTVTVKYDLELK